jgi:hypothetical protein
MATNNSTNNSYTPSYPLTLADGGTNANAFGTSTGIVKYDGTSLVTSTTSKLSSATDMTNTGQPAFLAINTGDQLNQTGSGTFYVVTFNSEIMDQASNFASNTFTAPITGKYCLYGSILLGGLATNHNNTNLQILTTAGGLGLNMFPGSFAGSNATSGYYVVSGEVFCSMTAGDTATLKIYVYGGSAVVDIIGSTTAGFRTPCFGGYLVC